MHTKSHEPDVAAEIVNGDSLKLVEIARQFNVNPSTVLRWLLRGLPNGRGERIRLGAIKRGKVWLTSKAALERFLAALPQSQEAREAEIRTPSQRERDCDRAMKVLQDKYGI